MADLTGKSFAEIFPKLLQDPGDGSIEKSDGTPGATGKANLEGGNEFQDRQVISRAGSNTERILTRYIGAVAGDNPFIIELSTKVDSNNNNNRAYQAGHIFSSGNVTNRSRMSFIYNFVNSSQDDPFLSIQYFENVNQLDEVELIEYTRDGVVYFGVRIGGTSASWYPRHLFFTGTVYQNNYDFPRVVMVSEVSAITVHDFRGYHKFGGDRAEFTGDIIFNDGVNLQTALDGKAGIEAGTWTPVYQASGGGGTADYSFQDGIYVISGEIVLLRFHLSSNRGTLNGGISIGGYPFSIDGGGLIYRAHRFLTDMPNLRLRPSNGFLYKNSTDSVGLIQVQHTDLDDALSTYNHIRGIIIGKIV